MSLELIIGLVGVIGLACLWAAAKNLSRTPKRRPVRAGAEGLIGIVLLGITALGTSVAINLQSYERLTKEKVVARIEFTKTGRREYIAQLELVDKHEFRSYELKGDEWEIKAQIMKWKPRAVVFGLDTQYRLLRLGVDFDDIDEARNATERTIHEISDNAGTDVYDIFNENPHWLPWVDTVFSQKGGQKLVDGAKFEISMSMSGMVVRAANDIAEQATQP